MSDERLRELERRWKESGAVEDEAALLGARIRFGKLHPTGVKLAGWLGHAAASSAVGPLVPEGWIYWGPQTSMLWGRSEEEVPSVSARGTLTCGRSEEMAIRLEDPTASRSHALIQEEGGELLISDVGSASGTYLNHRPVGEPTRLRFGDVIRIGQSCLTYSSNDPRSRPWRFSDWPPKVPPDLESGEELQDLCVKLRGLLNQRTLQVRASVAAVRSARAELSRRRRWEGTEAVLQEVESWWRAPSDSQRYTASKAFDDLGLNHAMLFTMEGISEDQRHELEYREVMDTLRIHFGSFGVRSACAHRVLTACAGLVGDDAVVQAVESALFAWLLSDGTEA